MEIAAASNEESESPRRGPIGSTPSSERANKTACTECRRQKVKCDAHTEIPCSRCKRVRAICEIVAPMKRVSKRKLLDSPQTSLPKRRLEIAPSMSVSPGGLSTPHGLPGTPVSVIHQTDVLNATNSHAQSPAPTRGPQSHLVTMSTGLENQTNTGPSRTALGLEELGMAAEIVRRDASAAVADPGNKEYVMPSSRSLEGIWVDGKTIDNVFKLYFLRYSPILPILDPSIHPDAYYEQLPFLFWCIIAVGSRRYAQDPTLFHSIAQRVVEPNLASLTVRPVKVSVVQALLLILTWGFGDRLSSKSSYPLSGLLVHLSMHMGLHDNRSGHDFLSTREKISEDERRRRGSLWAHCVLIYQRSCLRIGFAPLNVPRPKLPIGVELGLKSTPSEHMSFNLDFEVSLHDLMARASTALTENGLKFESVHQERGMCIILKIFEDQMLDLENKAQPLQEIDKLYLSICRLMILCMYLFQSPENIDLTCRSRLYVEASQTIDLINSLDKSADMVSYLTTYLSLGLILAAIILLRFLKGSFAKYLDYDACKASFFSALTMLKRSSVENNDGPARFALRLSNIWSGEMPDSSRSEELRVRSRLAMSVVFDTIWWSQDNDSCLHRAGCPHDKQPSLGSSSETFPPAMPFPYNPFFDDQVSFDLGWALSDDVFFASAGWNV